MAENEHRRFQPTSPATTLAGNAWDTWRDPRREPTSSPLTSSIDWLEGELGSFGPDGARR